MRAPVASATVRALLGAATAALARAGIGTARVDAEWLLAETLGVRRLDLLRLMNGEVPEHLVQRYDAAVARRARREPLQQVLGWEEFRGLRLLLTPDVLVPRPETEVLVDCALALLPPPARTGCLLAIDVGTGSGCIACALAHARQDLVVVATEVSPPAARVAARNVARLGLARRVTVVLTDVLAGVRPGAADLVVTNPPYLPTALLPSLMPEVRDHEPACALDGGLDGLAYIRRILPAARAALRRGGVLALETAGDGQVDRVAALLADAGFADVEVRADLTGMRRIVAGRRG